MIHTILGLFVCFFFDWSVLKFRHVCIRRREETDKQRQTDLGDRENGGGGGGVRKVVGNVRSTKTDREGKHVCHNYMSRVCVWWWLGGQTERQRDDDDCTLRKDEGFKHNTAFLQLCPGWDTNTINEHSKIKYHKYRNRYIGSCTWCQTKVGQAQN